MIGVDSFPKEPAVAWKWKKDGARVRKLTDPATGEVCAEIFDSRVEDVDLAVKAADGRAQTIMSCSDQNMDVVIDLARHALEAGVDLVLDGIHRQGEGDLALEFVEGFNVDGHV